MKFQPDIEEEIAHFFEPPPPTGAGDGNVHSILFLLRRDLRDLSCQEDIQDGELLKAPILASFGIMAGFEILIRAWTGCNNPDYTTAIGALQDIAGVDRNTAQMMRRFRNAIAHGYQLTIHDEYDNQEYRFAVSDKPADQTWFSARKGNDGTSTFHVNFWELRRRFFETIYNVQSILENPTEQNQRSNFYSVLNYFKPYEISPD